MTLPAVDIWLDPALKPDVLAIIKANLRRGRTRSRGRGCYEASMAWCGVIDEAGINRNRTRVVIGRYDSTEHRFLSPDDAASEPHAWLEIDGAVFDPTGGQWKDFPNLDRMKFIPNRQVA